MSEGDDEFWYRCLCGEVMRADPLYAGRLAICPRCATPVLIPSTEHELASEVKPSFGTARLDLAPARRSDWKRILPITSDPANYCYELSGPDTADLLKKSLKASSFPRGFRKSRMLTFLAARRGEEEVIGLVYLTLEPDHLRATIGVKIHHPWHGMGFGSEAVGAVTDFALRTLGLHRVSAACDAKNVACAKLFLSLGYHQEGELKDYVYHLERGWIDLLMFRRLAEE